MQLFISQILNTRLKIVHHTSSIELSQVLDANNLKCMIDEYVSNIEPNYHKLVIVSNTLYDIRAKLSKLKYIKYIGKRKRSLPQFCTFTGQGRMFMRWYTDDDTDKTIFIIPSRIIEGILLHLTNVMMFFDVTADARRLFQGIGRVIRLGNIHNIVHLCIDEDLHFLNLFSLCLEYIFDDTNTINPSLIDVSIIDKKLSKLNNGRLSDVLDIDFIDLKHDTLSEEFIIKLIHRIYRLDT